MPANTPIYGFTYPCDTDPVSFLSFQTLATQIDTRMASVQLDENYATGRYSSITQAANQGAIVAGVETVLTNAGSQYVIPADGVYWIMSYVRISIAANLSSSRIRVRLNGTPVFGRSYNAIPPQTLSGTTPVVGTVSAVTGDTISSAVLFSGTGPGTAQNQVLMVRMLVRTF